jgi:hypothetical protein
MIANTRAALLVGAAALMPTPVLAQTSEPLEDPVSAPAAGEEDEEETEIVVQLLAETAACECK